MSESPERAAAERASAELRIEWIDFPPMRTTGWTAEELETFMAGEWFSGMPYSPERIEEMREELRRQLRERDEARER